MSTLLLYLRVFPRRWFRITVMVGIALMIAQDTTYTFLVMIRCLPVPAIWDARVSGKCINLNIIGLTGAIVGITEHFIILLLPLPELWKLKLSRRKRVQLALVFMVGSLYVTIHTRPPPFFFFFLLSRSFVPRPLTLAPPARASPALSG